MSTNTPAGLVDADGKALPATQKTTCRVKWRDLYGWDATVATRKSDTLKDIHGNPLEEQLPFPKVVYYFGQRHLIPGVYNKTFTHLPRSIVLGAPRRGGVASTCNPPKNKRQARRLNQCKPTRYMVWHDRSLRRIDKIIKKQLSGMTKDQQAEFINQAMKGQPA